MLQVSLDMDDYGQLATGLSGVRVMQSGANANGDCEKGTDADAVMWRQMYLSRAKLKASSRTSALLAGFAMVALVELNLDTGISHHIVIVFAVCTTLLVSVHLLALMMSTCIEPHMDAVSQLRNLYAVSESPHVQLKWYIELAWFFSTVLGLLLFLVEVCVIFWIKFEKTSPSSAYIGTSMLIPVFVVFIMFTVTFYRRLSMHKFTVTKGRLDEVQQYFTDFENTMPLSELSTTVPSHGDTHCLISNSKTLENLSSDYRHTGARNNGSLKNSNSKSPSCSGSIQDI